MLRGLYQHFWLPFYRIWALRYVKKERLYRYGGLSVLVPPGVFHPGVFFSTPIFLDFLGKQSMEHLNIADVGAGSGVLGLFAMHRGAGRVVASDISGAAIETVRRNASVNLSGAKATRFETIQSDLFDLYPAMRFDRILINPPYYPKKPDSEYEFAFYAGPELEYFQKLFRQLPGFLVQKGKVWMILSEDCDLEIILNRAKSAGFVTTVVFERKKWGERLFVLESVLADHT